MNFTSLEFLLFFPLVLALHWRLPHRSRWVLLLAASWFFYLWWDLRAGFLLAAAVLISWAAGLAIPKARTRKQRRAALLLGAGAPLLILLIFKYAGFFARNAAGLLRLCGVPVTDPAWALLLPIGISFYTFQTMSYVVDVYWEKMPPETHLGYYALYVAFFPQLVAGPIERPDRLLPQLRAERRLQPDDLHHGMWRILRGFFKKLVVADYLAAFADRVFSAPADAAGPAVLFAAACFAVQIYCDFSGYSDIALGAARLLGIRLMENFEEPYGAESIREFWRRWHISLTSWFTDYLYKPLGGSRRGTARHCLNLLLVFLASGLWHGANWTFVLWGAIHGIYMVASVLAGRWSFHPLRGVPGRWGVLLRRAWVFALACFAWVFFRAESVGDALTLLSRLGSGWNAGLAAVPGLTGIALFRILLSLLCLKLFSRLPAPPPEPQNDAGTAYQALAVFFAALLIAAAWLSLLSANGNNVFIYFQF